MVAITLPGCSEQEKEPQAEIVRPVKTIVAGAADDSATIRQFPGRVDANQKVDLAFRVSGKLQSLPVREGDLVDKGQVIAELDPTDFKITLSDRRASHQEAKANFKRAAQLLPKGHISKTDYDRLEAAYKNTRAALDDARQQLNYTSLKAPFAGRVAQRLVQNFEEVQNKETIIELQDISSLEVKIDLPEGDIKRLRKDGVRPVLFARFDAAPDQQFPLTVKEFATVADPQTQTFRITLSMESPTSLNVLPGMTTSVLVDFTNILAAEAGVFTVPVTAVASDINGQPQVWVVDETTMTVAPRAVQVGPMRGASIEVRSGVQPGERLVVAGVSFLTKGQQVRLAPQVEQAEPLDEKTPANQ
jgi:RND family efflux transporter MFP subunit